MSELEKCRETITQIDGEMARLFEQRMETSAKIAAYKKENGLPVKDKAREDALISRGSELMKNPELTEYYADFIRGILDISCRYQEKLLSEE